MAKKVKKAAAKTAPATVENTTVKKSSSKKSRTPEQEAKRKERMEAMKNREPGQRSNSKTIDVIDFGANGKVLNYAHVAKTKGSLVTSVAFDGEGNVVGTSVCFVPGLKMKSKKGHGNFVDFKEKFTEPDDDEDLPVAPETDSEEDDDDDEDDEED